MKTADDKVLTVQGGSAAAPQNESGQKVDKSLSDLSSFWKLYSKDGSLQQGEFSNVYAKFKDKILAFLSGSKLSSNDLFDIFLALNANHGGKVGPVEADDTLTSRFPFLRWIPDNTTEIPQSELQDDIDKEYPDSSPWARQDLAQVLMQYDQTWAGGDGNGKVGRVELSGVGALLGFMNSTDFSDFQPAPGDDNDKRLIMATINSKLDQELYGCSPQLWHGSLSQTDLRLLWMELGSKFWLTDRIVHTPSERNVLDPKNPGTADALSLLGPDQHGHWQKLRELYNNKLMGGDGKGLSSIQSFSLVADLDYAKRILDAVGGNPTSAGVNAMNPETKKDLLATLAITLPLTGQTLTVGELLDPFNPGAIRTAFWDSLMLYDEPDYGGDGNGRIDTGELAMGLAFMRINENLFALYDKNGDGVIDKGEAQVMFNDLGLKDKRLVDAFFADVGLDGHDVSFWRKLSMFFGEGGAHIDRLGPYDFYVRLVKVLPQVLNPKPDKGRKGD